MATTADEKAVPQGDAEHRARRSHALEQLVGIGIAVMGEPDVLVLIERIVQEARRFTNAEAATLYVREGQELRVSVYQNETLTGRLLERTLRGRQEAPPLSLDAADLPAFVVRSGSVLAVADAYAIAPTADYAFDATWDRRNAYRTRSVFLLPLTDRAGHTLGVLELINARTEAGDITAFDVDADAEQLLRALAAQAAVALENFRLTELSLVDALTGAYNRRYFMRRLEQEAKRHARYEQPFSVVLFDVDDFKPINDRFGHAAGDSTLVTLSRLLAAQSRGFTVVARLGGDEFGAVLPQTPKSGAIQYGERLRRLIETYPFPNGRVTVSVGVAGVPDDLDLKASPDDLVQAADRALYEAKRLGRNRVASL